MLEVMYGAGLRLSELVNLDIKHLALDTGRSVGDGQGQQRAPPADWSQRCRLD